MSKSKLQYGNFFKLEIKRFVGSVPQMILLLSSIGAGVAIYFADKALSEVNRAILEGVVSGYIFYLFVDVIPKSEKRSVIVRKVADELSNVLSVIETLKINVKNEVIASGQTPTGQDTFFDILKQMIGTYMPVTSALKQIKGTTAPTAAQPIQFHYCTLDEVLRGELYRLTQKIQGFERASAVYGLADLDTDLMRIVSDLPTRPLASSGIQALQHVNNTPAAFGTDFDIIEKELRKLKSALQLEWAAQFP